MKRNSILIPSFISSNLIPLITAAVILSLMLVGCVGWNVWRMYSNFTKVVTTEFQLQSLTGEIVHLDEVLTMSARMAAATGNLDWEKRYRKFEPQLDKAIKKAIDLAPETYANLPIETDKANLKLVEMENESFDLVRQGKQQEALELLFSQKYELQKEIYATEINQTIDQLETRIKSNIEEYRQSLFWSSLLSLLILPILLLGWVAILKLLNCYVIQRNRAEITLKAAKLELEEINLTLEDKVKKRTAQLQEINRKLEDKVKERTAQLRAAKEKAESANKAKDRFIANISHELRTPLNSILGYTKILQRDRNLNPESENNLRIVRQSGTHLLTLINDILDFSKTSVGKMQLNINELHLESFLDGIVGIIGMWVGDKGLRLNCEYNNLPTAIEADSTRLRQVLINLLSNAIKFTDRGEVTFKVSSLSSSKSSGGKLQHLLRFEVIDTGVGISNEALEKIFQPFEQVGDVKSRADGTGLGLSISKQLVELMGGKLEILSELGQGTLFWFDLLVPAVEMNSDREPIQPIKTSQILGYKGKQRKLLIVDDKEENLHLLLTILKPIGFEVRTATNGQEMLQIAPDFKPDMILLDLFMPVKTGYTSIKQLRKISATKNIPTIIISAASITQEMSDYLKCEAYLSKPIEEEQLLKYLQKYLHLEWIYQEFPQSLA
ncbi:MAG: ATP-binding protein [Prochloraceae cyanobacterium]|nr:ATP-binding protein [Prochloraceae cyanobacterium]